MSNRNYGFTLIEIAIVLVIIGLLLGGILKGQEIITQAKIRNLINEMNAIPVLVSTYQERYRRMPGDDSGAGTRWQINGAAVASGNGDGLISQNDGFNSQAENSEVRLFWQHLRLSGLLVGDGADQNQPQNSFGGITGVQQSGLGINTLIICTTNLPAKVAAAIDSQIDDGNPARGAVRANAQTGNTMQIPNEQPAAGTVYDENTESRYTLCRSVT